MLNGLLIISDVNMAVYAGDEQSLNASGPGGRCIDLIPLAALVTVDLMSLPTQRTDRVCLLPLPVTVCMCDPFKFSSGILQDSNPPWIGASDEEYMRKEESLRIAVSYRELLESSTAVGRHLR